MLESWGGPRAEAFRRLGMAGGARGTAVTVQAMVFGNLGSASGAGVAFTRNPWSGEPGLLLDFRFGAQGEEVVSGEQSGLDQEAFARVMPEQFDALGADRDAARAALQRHAGHRVHDRGGAALHPPEPDGKRSPLAALRIAVDLVGDGVIAPPAARDLLAGIDLDAIRIRRVVGGGEPLGVGTPASGGVVSGTIAFTGDRAEADAAEGAVILVRPTASPDDIAGIQAASGLLVARGGRTSHAAVVARQLGKVCVVNCRDLSIDPHRHRCSIGETVLREGDLISLDGDTGRVYRGVVTTVEERPTALVRAARAWGLGPAPDPLLTSAPWPGGGPRSPSPRSGRRRARSAGPRSRG